MRMAALLVVILLAADAHGGEKQQCCPSDSASPGKAVATDQKPCLVEAPGAACGDCSRKQCGAIVLCCPAACGTACQSMPPAADRRIALRSQAERLDHLVAAAEHLDAAGLPAEADRMRRRMDAEVHALLEQIKQLELEAKPAGSAMQTSFETSRPVDRQVVVQVEMIEVDMAKTRDLGIDLREIFPASKRGEIAQLVRLLRKKGAAKVLAEPCMLVTNGVPASFIAGGEVPTFTVGGDGDGVECETFGVEIDLLANILDDGRIHLQLHPAITNLVASKPCSEKNGLSLRVRELASDAIVEDGRSVVVASWCESASAPGCESTGGACETAIYVLAAAKQSELAGSKVRPASGAATPPPRLRSSTAR